jgi:inosose dehydratase
MESRRRFLRQVTGAAALAAMDSLQANGSATIGLGYGTHGFKSYPAGEAIKTIAGIGYDSVELCLVPGWTEPTQCSSQERRELRSAIARYRLAVPDLFDRIDILGDAGQHKAHLERIRVDAQFGHDVNAGVGGVFPCIGTRLGGNTKGFEANRNLMLDRLHDWAEVGREMQTVIAVKGHPPMIVDTSERTLWLVQKVNSPWIRVEFDYSHFQTGGEELGKTLDRLLPYIVVIALQDNKKNNSKPGWEHTLPGDGDTDHEEYYRRLVKFGYNGHTVVWVNDGLLDRPGFDAMTAAKHCYTKLAPAMSRAGVRRPRYRNGA